MRYLEQYNIFETLKGKEYGRSLNPDDLQMFLDRFCKDFSWNDKPIYRGIYSTGGIKLSDVMLFNPKAIDRESANTSNYYTLLFDNSPYRNGFPKRSKSLICSTNKYVADDFGERVYRVIPFDGAKIAVCNSDDFWNSFPKINEKEMNLDDFNNTISFVYHLLTGKELQEKYHILIRQIEEMLPLYNELDEEKFEKINKIYWWKWHMVNILPKTLDGYFKLLDPIENDIKLYDYNDYKNLTENKQLLIQTFEVWTDSKAIFVDINSYRNTKKII